MSRPSIVTRMARGGLLAVSVGFAASVLVFGVSAAADPGNGHAATHRTQGNAGTSGSPTSPQPQSTADQTGGGANRSGPYDSTRNGSPSGNGNGKGQAVGPALVASARPTTRIRPAS